MIQLRKYQQDAISVIYETFKNTHTQFVEMPTGSGKTVTFLSYAKKFHKKTLIITPSIQLLNQTYKVALDFYNSHELSRKGDRFDEEISNMHICVINSIRGTYLEILSKINFDLIVIDEVHHSQAISYKRFLKYRLNHFDNSHTKILGVTATPDRLDGKLIEELVGDCSFKLEVLDLINQGYLSDVEGFIVKSNIDISDIDSHNGDFSLNKLYNKISNNSRNTLIVDLVKNEMLNRKCIIFCINIKHCKEINSMLIQSGISSAYISGEMDRKKKDLITATFKEGKLNVLCNCQLLIEGFDDPSIDGIIIARPTKSRNLFNQMIGRGLRICENKKNCKIIDILDNHRNLAGFSCIVGEKNSIPIKSFKSFQDLCNQTKEKKLEIFDSLVERVNIFDIKINDKILATQSIKEYLQENEIYSEDDLSFDEGTFLIWLNEMKKNMKKNKRQTI